MTLVWSIDPEKRLMTAEADGEVTRADMDGYLDAMAAGGAMAFRKLFDGSRGETAMTGEDMLALGVRIRGYQESQGEMGPLAIVLALDKMELVRRVVGMLAIADRPMKVFTSLSEARRWIDELKAPPPPRKKSARKPGRPPRTA